MKIQPATVCTPYHLTVHWNGKDFNQRATASADLVQEAEWWISRVLVQPKELRGQGIGTQLMEVLQSHIKKGQRLVVFPGGYDQDRDRQEAFYRKCGFVDSTEGGLVWRPV